MLKEKHLVALYVSEETLLNQVSRLPLFWNGLPDEVYQRVRPHFTDEELANLTLAVATINTWNRVCISFRVEEGSYQPKQTTSN